MPVQSPTLDVSAVTPAYNAAEWIRRTVDSALAQSVAPREVIVVDDGSTDGTADVVAAHEDARVRCIRQANAGPAAARNRGIAEATGEWIALLDADDIWLPGHLERAANALNRCPFLVWYADDTQNEEPDGTRSSMGDPRHCEGLLVDGLYLPSFLQAASHATAISSDVVVIRRQILADFGGFNEGLPRCEDWDLWLRLGLAHPRIGYCTQPGARRFLRAESLSNTRYYDLRPLLSRLKWFLNEARHASRSEFASLLCRLRRLLETSMRHALVSCNREGVAELLRDSPFELSGVVRASARLSSLLPPELARRFWRLMFGLGARIPAVRSALRPREPRSRSEAVGRQVTPPRKSP